MDRLEARFYKNCCRNVLVDHDFYKMGALGPKGTAAKEMPILDFRKDIDVVYNLEQQSKGLSLFVTVFIRTVFLTSAAIRAR